MEPTRPSRSEGPFPDRSPCRPSLNGAEHAQRAFPSPILRSSTLSILSPIPTHPQSSLVAEAGSATTNTEIERDAAPGGFLAEIDQYTHRGPGPVMPRGHGLRHLHRPSQSKHEHLEKEESEGTEKEKEREKARERELDRQRQQRRARKHPSRRTQPFSAEALANNLGTFSMDEPLEQQRDPREDYNQCMKRWSRGFRARYRCKVREQAMARQMRELERRIQGGAEGIGMGMDVDGGEGGEGDEVMATDVRRTDTNHADGAPTGDGDVQLSSTQFASHPQSKEG